MEFYLVYSSEHDSQALSNLLFYIAPQSCIYMTASYKDWLSEEDWLEVEGIVEMAKRNNKSKRPIEMHINFLMYAYELIKN